ncbi:hypothetical protein HYC85_004401 [Camellia sinensis]|uniref:Transmembrane protein n=1 Tax=Camellia sinensis TaxID=4442 RepID=A0A7J7HYH2_CAMSI|nr:hypothetical protein HYC85_004401 [Camellia sinensis]
MNPDPLLRSPAAVPAVPQNDVVLGQIFKKKKNKTEHTNTENQTKEERWGRRYKHRGRERGKKNGIPPNLTFAHPPQHLILSISFLSLGFVIYPFFSYGFSSNPS